MSGDDTTPPVKALAAHSDDELLELVRKYRDEPAYALLWQRHRTAALTQARRLANADAEDVVSEAFTQIWEQTIAGRGPREGRFFRAYTLTTVRNIAARWHKKQRHVVTAFEFSQIEKCEDTRALPHEQEEYASAIAALNTLPERWQEVLVRFAVDNQTRSAIAADLGMSPNSVSALRRRAVEGLRLAWLRQMLPGDAAILHPAIVDQLPKYVMGGLSRKHKAELSLHLRQCQECAQHAQDLLGEAPGFTSVLKRASVWMILMGGGGTAIHGLSASASSAAVGVTVGKPVAFAIASGKVGVTGGIVAVGAVAALVTGIWVVNQPSADSITISAVPESRLSQVLDQHLSLPLRTTAVIEEAATEDVPLDGVQEVAESLPTVESPTTDAPVVESPIVPVPMPTPPPETDLDSVKEHAVLTATKSEDYSGAIAPIINGTSEADTGISISIANSSWNVSVTSLGSWSFDVSQLGLDPGTYVAQVTQLIDGRSTLAIPFEITAPVPLFLGLHDSERAIHIVGIPRMAVCVQYASGSSQVLTISNLGSVTAWIPAHSIEDGPLQLQYCVDGRFGATIRVTR